VSMPFRQPTLGSRDAGSLAVAHPSWLLSRKIY
jgi:hypothetical protein